MMTKQAELKKQAYASDLKSRALSVLIYLIDRSNKDLTCFPAIPTMAEQLHISVSTVKRALHELVQAGFIKKDSRFRDKNRGQTSNLYTLMFREQTSNPVEEKKPENKENTFNCGVEHISFDTLKKEQVVDKAADKTICEAEETDIKCGELQTEQEPAAQIRHMMSTPIQVQQPNLLCGSKIRRQACDTFQQRVLPVSFPWTGAGFNLQPP